MSTKTYDQYCAVARALEVVGERWTILIVRELLTGPKRFTDLRAGLPGIATNLLSDRLEALKERGVLWRVELPPPAASTVYELTERGRELKPVILALADWGLPLLGEPREGDGFRLGWLLLALEDRFDEEAATGLRLTYEFRVGYETMHATIADRILSVAQGPANGADVILVADVETFLAWGMGRMSDDEALAAGLEIHGGKPSLELLRTLFGK